MSVSFLKSGILTTLQDSGRNGFRRFGVNPGGAMDRSAARLINILLGNAESEAALEMHFPAPVLQFAEEAVGALGGADFSARLNGESIENWRIFFVRRGDVLSFPVRKFGARLYLAVRGGFAAQKWLGSASANLRAGIGTNLKRGDKLFFNRRNTDNEKSNYRISASLIPHYSRLPTLRVTAGAEFEHLTRAGAKTFFENSFAVTTHSDRMGFRLRGEPIYPAETLSMISAAVNFGTIQLLPDGQMIILMAEHQTIGGYPRLAHIAEVDLPLAAQLNPHDRVYFRLISQLAAENLILEREKNMNLLKTAIKFKTESYSKK